ncbi:Winged helix DNA-binding domain superfamily [Arabidopsis thaliana x Arabidopsis arenosa]|uniref:Winged helix DNA-binding domain superfamily n=1 Tax=Arabidopsis thaliana x Arabidopsis arenosa TaxID=1240361 RepID=A0A8T1ZP76_9BRAS|nr:Winged helix DNA-binding domain superfamily [Arabidopsis thaliana x Arabidopsis arenosa]
MSSSSKIESEKPVMVLESLFSTKTPNKTVKRQIFSSSLKPEFVVKLPERFEILEEFFNGLDTAIRLLKLKGSSTTYANICPKIEYLTNRIFSYDHLAQMKHIYPEAIELKRVLKYVEDTCCMKPSLHIKLNTDAIVLDDTICGTKYMELRKVFHSKLVDFYKAYPKDEVPKELLPEPFNSPKRDSYSGIVSVGLGAPKLEVGGFDVHMEEIEQEEQDANKAMPESTLSHIESRIVETPVNDSSTPSKDLSTPIRLMSATPTLQLSKRCIELTPEGGDDNSVRSTNSLARGPSRCLNFDTLEEDAIVKDDIGNESDDEGDGLLQSVKGSSRSLNFETLEEDTIVKDDISNEPGDEKINYEADNASDDDSLLQSMKERPKTEPKKDNWQQLVNLIHTLFHSTNRTVITKEELLHKIIANQINITDRREVEEQLSLMLQLVPDWISETKASSGDLLVRINKMSAAETVRAKLEEATSQDISLVY